MFAKLQNWIYSQPVSLWENVSIAVFMSFLFILVILGVV
jgi:hypothetical protein